MNKDIKYLVERLFDDIDDILDNDESTEDELNIADNIAQYKFVDLGLPSGMLWCDRNLGAKSPGDYGLYYQWGCLQGIDIHTDKYFNQYNYPLNPAQDNKKFSKYNQSKPDIHLKKQDDAAYVQSSGIMHIPTKRQFDELIRYCTLEKTTINGINGVYFISTKNNNRIFFPFAGHTREGEKYNSYLNVRGFYWTNELYYTDQQFTALYKNRSKANDFMIIIKDNGHKCIFDTYENRYMGFSIRPIKTKSQK